MYFLFSMCLFCSYVLVSFKTFASIKHTCAPARHLNSDKDQQVGCNYNSDIRTKETYVHTNKRVEDTAL